MQVYDYVSKLCFFFNDTATTEIYTLSLHDALPILGGDHAMRGLAAPPQPCTCLRLSFPSDAAHSITRSEEHTSELQSRQYLVCRLLLEKKKNTIQYKSNYPRKRSASRFYSLSAATL